MIIKKFSVFANEFITESSIGSEAIRAKYYSDMDKKLFYTLVNSDPSSVRKPDFSKPGRYTKWLINVFKKFRSDVIEPALREEDITSERVMKGLEMTDEDKAEFFEENRQWRLEREISDFLWRIKEYLHIFSTAWYKRRSKNDLSLHTDIFKYKTIQDFKSKLGEIYDDFERETQGCKYDVIYTDDRVKIVIPINFAACYDTAKNTEWCTTTRSGWNIWNRMSALIRIIPLDSKYDKLKLTVTKSKKLNWNLACSKYPEVSGSGLPFEEVEGDETWLYYVKKFDESQKVSLDNGKTTVENYKKWKGNMEQIIKTMKILTNEAKKSTNEYLINLRDSESNKLKNPV